MSSQEGYASLFTNALPTSTIALTQEFGTINSLGVMIAVIRENQVIQTLVYIPFFVLCFSSLSLSLSLNHFHCRRFTMHATTPT